MCRSPRAPLGTAGWDTASGGIAARDFPIVDVPAGGASFDGNTVDLDRTMVSMAENALQYGASARAAGKKLAILNTWPRTETHEASNDERDEGK